MENLLFFIFIFHFGHLNFLVEWISRDGIAWDILKKIMFVLKTLQKILTKLGKFKKLKCRERSGIFYFFYFF